METAKERRGGAKSERDQQASRFPFSVLGVIGTGGRGGEVVGQLSGRPK